MEARDLGDHGQRAARLLLVGEGAREGDGSGGVLARVENLEALVARMPRGAP